MKNIFFILKVAVTLGVVAWLFTQIDSLHFSTLLGKANLSILLAGTALTALLPILGAVRWFFILRYMGMGFELRQIIYWTYIATFFNQLLPATVGGDGLRVYFASRNGASLKRLLYSVVLDRVAMFISLAILLVIFAPWFISQLTNVSLMGIQALLGCAVVVALILLMTADQLPIKLSKFPPIKWLGELSQDARLLLLTINSCLVITALSFTSLLIIMISMWLFVVSFGAVNTTAFEFLPLMPPVVAASTLPISFGGWGTREIAMVSVCASIGISAEVAILSSVWLGIASILTNLPGAALHLMGNKYQTTKPTNVTF
jgi:glycosyltransferase 2 family protein